jgi:hypothetical protein
MTSPPTCHPEAEHLVAVENCNAACANAEGSAPLLFRAYQLSVCRATPACGLPVDLTASIAKKSLQLLYPQEGGADLLNLLF